MTTDATDPVAEHTPTPWEVRLPARWIVSPAGDAELGNWLVAREVRWEQDAAFIVTACNSYHAMKEALEAFVALSGSGLLIECDAAVSTVLDQARAALGNQVKT